MEAPERPFARGGRRERADGGAVRLEPTARRPAEPRWDVRRGGPERRWVRLGVLALALLLLAVLLYRQIDRWRGTVVEVPVAAASLTPGTRVEAAHLGRTRVRERDLPAGVVTDPQTVVGRQMARAKQAGAPFFRQDFAPPDLGPGLAGVLPEGRVLVFVRLSSLPIDELVEQLRFGDRFDIVAVGNLRGGGYGAVAVAHDAFFVGWIADRREAESQRTSGSGLGAALTEALSDQTESGQGAATTPLLLAVEPADAVALSEAQAARAPLHLVLHGSKEVQKGQLLTLPRTRITEVELITGSEREMVPLNRPGGS